MSCKLSNMRSTKLSQIKTDACLVNVVSLVLVVMCLSAMMWTKCTQVCVLILCTKGGNPSLFDVL